MGVTCAGDRYVYLDGTKTLRGWIEHASAMGPQRGIHIPCSRARQGGCYVKNGMRVGPMDVKCGVCAGEASLIPYPRARAGVGTQDGWRAGPMLSATR